MTHGSGSNRSSLNESLQRHASQLFDGASLANFKINYTLQKQSSTDMAIAEEMKGEHSSAIGLSSGASEGGGSQRDCGSVTEGSTGNNNHKVSMNMLRLN